MTRRQHVPYSIKLAAALLQLGLDPKTAELDHNPALARRRRLPDGRYDPDESDPRFLQWKAPEAHAEKTFGRGGEKRITTAGSDIGEIAKMKRLTKDEEAFRSRLLAKEPGEPRQKRGTIPARVNAWPPKGARKVGGTQEKRT